MKKLGLFILALSAFLFLCGEIRAESIAVTLTKKEEPTVVGEKFMLKMRLSSLVNYKKMEGFLAYDDTKVEFVSADDGISGGGGKLKINIENLLDYEIVEEFSEDYGVEEENPEAEETKRVFQMVFKALKPGKVSFQFVEGMKVFSETDAEMSVSNTPLDVVIQGKREASGESSLSDLKVADRTLQPEFSKHHYQYRIQVPKETEKLILSATPTDEKAAIVVAGNDKFQFGDNLVKLIVTAEDGTESVYELIVTREESAEETAEVISSGGKEDGGASELSLGSEETKEEVTLAEEEKESKEEHRKKTIFYAIMGVVGLITFIILKFLLMSLRKMEEEEENSKNEKDRKR